MELQYSFIIPVYNRPQEIEELLQSFQTMKTSIPFEIVIVEDGSSIPSKEICNQFSTLHISYYFKENSGPGDSRNYGMKRAEGNYFIILDSDVILPPHYLNTVDAFLQSNYKDCYGGADAADASFSLTQKAINYVMTSFLTTGGIRGKENSVSKFEPRSFNMGMSKQVFEKTGGYGNIHPGEDPDVSQRILKAGFQTAFLPNAFVYHKRRISWSKFYTQVHKFGLVRPILNRWHPEAAKITFWFPTVFVIGVLIALFCLLIGVYFPIFTLGVYVIAILIHASLLNRNIIIGLLAVVALFIQFFGYGLAFLKSTLYLKFSKKSPDEIFPKLFF